MKDSVGSPIEISKPSSDKSITMQNNISTSNTNNESISEAKKTNLTKASDESREYRELNKEIFQIIQQGGNTSGVSFTNKSNSSIGATSLSDNTSSKITNDVPHVNFVLKEKLTNKKMYSMIPNPNKTHKIDTDESDDIPNTIETINSLHIQQCKTNNLSEIDNYQYKNNNYVPKANFGLVPSSYPPMTYLTNYYNNMYMYENSFTYANMNTISGNNMCNVNNIKTEHNGNKRKKKFKEKLDQTLFTINLDQIIMGRDTRTTIMIRHIPNKYTSQMLLEEIDYPCKGKYDFFYLPIDNDSNLNLGYSFINFVNPLHIIFFYHLFKARKWNHFNSHKECDLTFAKFQGKIELTAHLEKNMNKLDDNKKYPMLFTITTHPQIEFPKEYYEYISIYRKDLISSVCFK